MDTAPIQPKMQRGFEFPKDPAPTSHHYNHHGIPTGCCVCIPENEHWALLYFGKYDGTLTEPGIYCLNTVGLSFRPISTKQRTLQLNGAKVLDAKGNPIVVNGCVTFVATSAKKATIDVENPWPMSHGVSSPWYQNLNQKLNQKTENPKTTSILELQAQAVLKQTCARYPYEAPHGEQSLQTEGEQISQELKVQLQERIMVTGGRVISFDLIDLSYAPEIAQMMLVRQQAEAFIDARKLIVQAAVDMASSAIEQLKAKDLVLSEAASSQITSNLLTVICSNQSASPMLPM